MPHQLISRRGQGRAAPLFRLGRHGLSRPGEAPAPSVRQAAGLRTCSGRKPIPISRAGMRASGGTRLNSRTGQGAVIGASDFENRVDDPLLDRDLHRLRQARRQGAAALHGGEMRIGQRAVAQRHGEDVGGGDGVLDREVDADPADRRHRVRAVADAQQARPPPALQPIDRDGQQLDIVPVAQFARPGRAETARSRRYRRGTRRGRAPAPRRTRPCGSRTRIASNRRGRASPACGRN